MPYLPVTQSQVDYQLLQQYLCEDLYANADLIYDTDPDELIEYCFRQYYVFLFSSHELPVWYKLFQGEAYRLLALRGINNEQAEYRLRSIRFCKYAQAILTHVKNDVRSTDASTPGEDLTHVCA